MDALRILVKGSFSSFREVKYMRYQRSYPIPTKTTIIGLVGAALGVRGKSLEELFKKYKIGVVRESIGGFTQDLWSLVKPKESTKTERAVYLREMLFLPVYRIYFVSENPAELENLSRAYSDPKYPLVLGKNDELICIKENEIVELKDANRDAVYRNTILPFNYRTKHFQLESIDQYRGVAVKPPHVLCVPSSFLIDDEGICRDPTDYREITFVENIGIKFKDVRGLTDGANNFFLW